MGGTAIQRVINDYGTVFVAGFTATNKLYGLMEMAAVSLGGAVSAYTGQNWGACKYSRIRRGTTMGAVMAVGVSFLIAGVLFLLGKPVLSLFIEAEDPKIIEACLIVAQDYLNAMLVGLFTLYLLYIYRSALQGMGDTMTPMVSGLAELMMRVGAVLVLPLFFGQAGVYFAELCAWAGAALLLMAVYYIRIRSLPKADGT